MAARPRLLRNPDQIDRADEIGGGAVHDRRFWPVDLDQDIVNPETRERGQKMFDCADAGAGSIAEHGAELGLRHIGSSGLQETLASARQSGAEEDDAGVDIGRMKDDLSRLPGVYAGAPDRHAIAQRGLKAKPHLQLFPGLRPAPIAGIGLDKERQAPQPP